MPSPGIGIPAARYKPASVQTIIIPLNNGVHRFGHMESGDIPIVRSQCLMESGGHSSRKLSAAGLGYFPVAFPAAFLWDLSRFRI